MRTILLALLLASAASPAFADEPGRNRWQRADGRSERSAETRAERPQRNAEPRNVERAAPQRSIEARDVERAMPQRNLEPRNLDRGALQRSIDSRNAEAAAPEPVERRSVERPSRSRSFEMRSVGEGPQRIGEARESEVRQLGGSPETQPAQAVERRAAGDSVREWRAGERARRVSPASIEERVVRRAPPISEMGDLVQPKQPLPQVLDPAKRRVSRTPVFGTEPPEPRTATALAARPERQWSHDWRHDRKYDWRDWRSRHRSRFYFGRYYDPFGWNYHRYGIGWRLWPSYYRNSFWLGDPWYYRLPHAYGPYRWVRYYGDVLLVNIYTGEVVDVVHSFFW